MLRKKIFYIPVFIIIISLSFIFNISKFTAFGETNTNNDSDEVKQLNRDIEGKKDELAKLQKQQDAYKKAIAAKQNEQASLSNQMAILDNRLAEAQIKIDQTKLEIERVSLEIKRINLDIEDKTEKIEREKKQLGNALKLLYKEDSKSNLQVLLTNNYLTDFVDQVKYLEDVQKEVNKNLDSVKKYKTALDENKANLLTEFDKFKSLKTQLEDQKIALVDEKDTKTNLLDQTRNSERQYQGLLDQAKREQQNANADIANLERAVRAKIESMKGNKLEALSDTGYIWPTPSHKVNAYFHDPEYPFRYVYEHPAIDIKASQGTELKAAASGYVARTKNAGMGYSYIMIVHANGLATVYGHTSKIYVKEEQYVSQGEVIGLSGGMPGTPGAGGMTTGAHLHFEIRSNGIPVNPLNYLP